MSLPKHIRTVVATVALLSLTASAWAYLRLQPQEMARPTAAASSSVTTVVLVRHAERGTDDPADPSLTTEGQARAEALATALDGAEVSTVYSTPYKRTRDTAQPLAKRFHLEVTARPVTSNDITVYAEQFAKEVLTKDAGKTVVIVGHSNTVPALVKVFSGRTVTPYTETEYDRFYLVQCPAGTGSKAQLFETRYGKPGK